jgi:hypothetical protein
MPTITPIARSRHSSKFWRRNKHYSFASKNAVAPLALAELPQATRLLPVCFIAQGEDFVPAAVLGLAPGENLLVAPNGDWLGPYIPAVFRSYPFALARAEEDREVLCIDEDSGLVTDEAQGEAFFADNGEPSKAVADIMTSLQQLRANQLATRLVCANLKEHGLFRPLPLTVKRPSGEQRVDGLYCIDEAAFNALPDEAFLKVRAAGGLPVIYCHLLSLQLLPALADLAGARAEAATRQLPINAAGNLDLEFMNDGPMLDFGKLK